MVRLEGRGQYRSPGLPGGPQERLEAAPLFRPPVCQGAGAAQLRHGASGDRARAPVGSPHPTRRASL